MQILTGKYLAETLKRGDKILLEATVVETDRSKSPLKLSFDSTDYGRGDVWFSGDANFTVVEPPQAEKVEVPDFVAEWYRANKANLESNIAAAFRRIGSDEHYTVGSIYEWLNDSSNNPIQTLFKMKNGYTVKPKRWVVKKINSGAYFINFRTDELSGIFGLKQYAETFTDKAKAEAVATLVDGTVEEV